MTAIEMPSSVSPFAENSATVSFATSARKASSWGEASSFEMDAAGFGGSGLRGSGLLGGERSGHEKQTGDQRQKLRLPPPASRLRAQVLAPPDSGNGSGPPVGFADVDGAPRCLRRARTIATITDPTTLNGTAIISRIDQYIPRHMFVPATALLGCASLQRGHAERIAGRRTQATRARTSVFPWRRRIVIP
jgi:hypothetical protein